jgi:hypothetical protein
MADTNQNSKPRFGRKPGRTLLVQKTSDSFDSSSLEELEGLTSNHHTEKSNSYFLTFETLPHSMSAIRDLKANYDDSLRVKFAHYRVFFTLQGLTEDSDYTKIKSTHAEYVTSLGGNVLFYKLYRKQGTYLGCGELTIDTKETLDLLVNKEDSHRDFTFQVESVDYSGTHYRFNRRSKQDDEQLYVSNLNNASV